MKQKNTIWEITELLIVAVILAVVIRLFFVSAYKIPSGSMLQTLQVGDYLLVTRFNYDVKVPFTDISMVSTGDPEYGDIIVFRFPGDPKQDYIKRLIGKPGDTIEVRDTMVFRNGKLLKEPYTQFVAPGNRKPGMAPLIVPEGHYFMMGDNRDQSEDSRSWGFVPRKYMHGKAWVIYWSWEGFANIRWNRLGTFLYPDASERGV